MKKTKILLFLSIVAVASLILANPQSKTLEAASSADNPAYFGLDLSRYDSASLNDLTLVASRSYKPAKWQDAKAGRVSFVIPSRLPITSGGADKDKASIVYALMDGKSVKCEYVSAKGKKDKVLFYDFKSCSNGLKAGDRADAVSFNLHIFRGDKKQGATTVTLVLKSFILPDTNPAYEGLDLSPYTNDVINDLTLVASRSYKPAKWQDAEAGKTSFILPSRLPITSGGADKRKVQLTYVKADGKKVTCSYQGVKDKNRLDFPFYNFLKCSNGLLPGDRANASSLTLHIDSGDKKDGQTVVTLTLKVFADVPPAPSIVSFDIKDSVTGSDELSGVAGVDVSAVIENQSSVEGYYLSEYADSPDLNGSFWQTALPSQYSFVSGDGDKVLYLWIKYQLGMKLLSAEDGILVDSTAPTALISPLDEEYLATGFEVSWSGDDGSVGSGLVSYEVEYRVCIDASCAGGDWQDWLNTDSAAAVFELPLNPGDYISFHVRASDLAGNIGDWSEAVTTRIKPEPPAVISSFKISDLSSNSSVCTNENTVGISAVIENQSSVVGYYLTEISAKPALNGDFWLDQMPSSYVFSAGDGSKVLFLWVKYQSGNKATSSGASILLDTTAPLASMNALNSEYSDTGFEVSWFGDDGAVGSGIGRYVAEYRVCQDLYCDGVFWKQWVSTTAESVVFSEPVAPGNHIFFKVHAYDAAENEGDWSNEVGTFIKPAVTEVQAITDLSTNVVVNAIGEVKAYWSAPQMPVYAPGTRYEIRYYTKSNQGIPCDLEARWDSSLLLPSYLTPTPSPIPGVRQEVIIDGLWPGAPACIGIKTFDGISWSVLSNQLDVWVNLPQEEMYVDQAQTLCDEPWADSDQPGGAYFAQSFYLYTDSIRAISLKFASTDPEEGVIYGIRLCKGLPVSAPGTDASADWNCDNPGQQFLSQIDFPQEYLPQLNGPQSPLATNFIPFTQTGFELGGDQAFMVIHAYKVNFCGYRGEDDPYDAGEAYNDRGIKDFFFEIFSIY